jgi:hypothetical protein
MTETDREKKRADPRQYAAKRRAKIAELIERATALADLLDQQANIHDLPLPRNTVRGDPATKGE